VALDTAALERRVLQFNGLFYSVFKIPRAAILDLMGGRNPPEIETSLGSYRNGWRVCEPFASPVFERAESQLVSPNVDWAVSRRSLGFTSSGAEILQRTRNSARDFEKANTPLLRSLRK
jgi:hypothetical protein